MNKQSTPVLNRRLSYYTFILIVLYPWLDDCVAKRTYIDESTQKNISKNWRIGKRCSLKHGNSMRRKKLILAKIERDI